MSQLLEDRLVGAESPGLPGLSGGGKVEAFEQNFAQLLGRIDIEAGSRGPVDPVRKIRKLPFHGRGQLTERFRPDPDSGQLHPGKDRDQRQFYLLINPSQAQPVQLGLQERVKLPDRLNFERQPLQQPLALRIVKQIPPAVAHSRERHLQILERPAIQRVVSRGFRDQSTRYFLVSGLPLGLATLTRGTTLYFPLIFVLFALWLIRRFDRQLLVQLLVFFMAFAAVLAPWTARNAKVLHAFIPSSTPGLLMLNGSDEEFWEIASRDRAFPEYFRHLRIDKGISAPPNPTWADKDRFYRRAAIEKYRERWETDPLSFLPFLAKKFARVWYATETGRNHMYLLLANLPIYLLALFGVWAVFKQRSRLAYFLPVLIAYLVILHVAVFADPARLFAEVHDALRPGGRVLFAEPKGHAREHAFDESLSLAERSGLRQVRSLQIPWSRAALLEK